MNYRGVAKRSPPSQAKHKEKMPVLSFTVSDNQMMVSGKTFHAKEALKAACAKWSSEKSSWILPMAAFTQDLKESLTQMVMDVVASEKAAAKTAAKAVVAYEASPEGRKARLLAALAQKAKTGAFCWICCEQCTVMDWQRQHTSCQVHSHDGNTVRVRGAIYTGD